MDGYVINGVAFFENIDSTVIDSMSYDTTCQILHLDFKNGKSEDYKVSAELYSKLIIAPSIGRFLNDYVFRRGKNVSKQKSNMSTTNSNAPVGVNNSSDKTRYIKLKIDVMKIKKEWLFSAPSGAVYADLTLHLLPDGEVDDYENLGMITQDVPKKIWENDRTVRGAILGNGRENEFRQQVATPGIESGSLGNDLNDDLPF